MFIGVIVEYLEKFLICMLVTLGNLSILLNIQMYIYSKVAASER